MTSLVGQRREESSPGKFWNRTHATERLLVEMAQAQHDANHRFSILLVEFDGLSDITARLGHASGQDVWRRVLGVLMQDLGPQDLCCRLSGDEFLLILPNKQRAECAEIRDRILDRWNPGAGTREAAIEVNVGIASHIGLGSRIETLLGAADESLHVCKLENETTLSTKALALAQDGRRTSDGRTTAAATGRMADRRVPLTIKGVTMAHHASP